MGIHYRLLDERSFSLSGSNFISSGISNQLGYYIVVDPTVINNLGGTPSSTIAAATLQSSSLRQSAFDPAQPAADFAASNWVSKGWNDPSDLTSWRNQVRDWLTNNLSNATLNPGSNDINFYLLDTTISGTRYLVPIVYLGADGPKIDVDADAQAFITATGITDATQQSALNNLVTDLKSYNLWSKIVAAYPFVGGTASTHKYNLKDPRDLDAAYRLTFSGSWSHSSSGAIPTSNSYADTHLNPYAQAMDIQNYHMSFYTKTAIAGGSQALIGNIDSNVARYTILGALFSGSIRGAFFAVGIGAAGFTNSNTGPAGLLVGASNGSTSFTGYSNGVKGLSSTSLTTLPNASVGIAAATNAAGGVSYYAANSYAAGALPCTFASVGIGLTDSNVINLYTAVQTYQTALSRQV